MPLVQPSVSSKLGYWPPIHLAPSVSPALTVSRKL